jgi:hypothetical protein
MTDPFTKPFADMLKAAPYGQLPEHVKTLVDDGLAKTREATLKSFAVAKHSAEAFEKVALAAQRDAGELAGKIFDQAVQNTEAAFIAAKAIAQAKSPVEAAELQAKYAQAQLTKAGEQSRDLLELSTKLAQKTAEAVTGFATKSAAQYKV